MGTKVDVLAALDKAIEAAEHHEKLASVNECPGHICVAYSAQVELRKARAAVAELIAAVTDATDPNWTPRTNEEAARRHKRVMDALAGVKP